MCMLNSSVSLLIFQQHSRIWFESKIMNTNTLKWDNTSTFHNEITDIRESTSAHEPHQTKPTSSLNLNQSMRRKDKHETLLLAFYVAQLHEVCDLLGSVLT